MKTLSTSVLIAIGIIIYSCNSKNENAASTPDSNSEKSINAASSTGNSNSLNGMYNASGTITFTTGGVNYSCNISNVIAASTTLTFQTSQTDVRTNGNITITCYTASSAITTGTYTATSNTSIASVTFIDKNVTPFTATSATSGSSCSVIISTLTPTSVQGTFTATALKPLDHSSINITNGVINCTVTSKQ
jgi:hypothetical protein